MDCYIVFDIETTGLQPWSGDFVTCICAKTCTRETFTAVVKDPQQEREIIEGFFTWLAEKKIQGSSLLISKAGKTFDLPFLYTRLALLQGELQQAHTLINSFTHLDIQEWIKKWLTLDELATLFHCQGKNGNGWQAINLWKEKKFAELQNYCMQDVNVTEEVYLAREKIREAHIQEEL